jgi:hypothetical protein
MVKFGSYRGEKVRYPDGVGCCIWQVMEKDNENDEDSAGICFDFPFEDHADVIKTVLGLDSDVEKVYEPDLEHEKFEAERKALEEKRAKEWFWQFLKAVEDVGVQIVPFDWQWNRFFITRPVSTKNGWPCGKLCKGFHFGPLVVTW